MIYCGKAEFGQISRSFKANSGAIHRKRPKNLTQICFPSLRSVKPDRLLEHLIYTLDGHDTHVITVDDGSDGRFPKKNN
jgi:hypothetical protein